MGYDAHVRCRCWQDGLAKPFPHDFEIQVDEAGYWDPLEEWPDNDETGELTKAYFEKEQKIEDWLATACQHKYMRLVDVRIANIFGMQTFKHALHEVGASKFPILLAELPTANGGSASPEIAARMLKEIEQFEAIDIIQTQVFLADDEKRIAIQEYLPSRQGVFSHHAGLGIDLGVDEYGFFVARRHREDTEPIAEMAMTTYSVQEPREDLFRAVLFEVSHPDHETFHFSDLRNAENVVTVSGDSVKHSATANFSDTESGNVLNVPLGQKRRYRALAQNIGPDYFEYILTPLRTVCEASIQTGNPIQWT